ncbi:MAG: exodeoxyribonuclease VII small subunit [Nitrospinota bacterium]
MTDLKFEDALARLEQLVHMLEGGNLPLEESLQAFEEGIGLVRHCAKYLEEAGRRLEVLTKDESGLLKSQPFAPEGTEGSQ